MSKEYTGEIKCPKCNFPMVWSPNIGYWCAQDGFYEDMKK